MITIGQINELEVYEKNASNYILRAPDFDHDVSLPKSEVNKDLNVGDVLEAFIYVDNTDEPIASLKTPYAFVDQYFVARVVETHQFGAFVDWGINKRSSRSRY